MNKIPALLCLLFAFAGRFGQCQDKDQAPAAQRQAGIAAKGLTRTLADLLAAKPATCLAVGSRRMLLEGQIGADLFSALDCDATISDYLNGEGELYYEELAREMEGRIRERLEGEEGSLFASVDASAEGNVMRFSFYLRREKPLRLPVAVESRDGSFWASSSVDCLAILSLSAELMVDSDIVINADPPAGVKLRIADCTLSLRSRPAGAEDSDGVEDFEEPSPVPVAASYSCRGAEGVFDKAYVDLRARASWFLSESDFDSAEDEGEPDYLPYSAIAAGRFTWQTASEGWLRFGSTAADVDDEAVIADGRPRFAYAADGIASWPAQVELRVFAGDWSIVEKATMGGE